MLNDFYKEKLKRFMSDNDMVQAVYLIALSEYTKNQPTDSPEMLAAQRKAIDLLNDTMKELEKYKPRTLDQHKGQGQPGL